MRRWLFVAAVLLALLTARADDGFDPRVVRLASLAIGGVAAASGSFRAPPVSLVAVAWPSAYRADSTWSLPDGGRRPMLYVTLVNLRF